MKLVGLTGPARCGKTTVTAAIDSQFGIVEMAFAGPLKNAACILLARPMRQVEGRGYDREQVMKEWGFSMRHFLQTLGTEGMRELFRDDFWIRRLEIELDQMIKVYHQAGQKMPGVIISDVRFENEATFIRRRGGTIWHVERDVDNGLADEQKAHASEAGVALQPGDKIIMNDGDLGDLQDKAIKIWQL